VSRYPEQLSQIAFSAALCRKCVYFVFGRLKGGDGCLLDRLGVSKSGSLRRS